MQRQATRDKRQGKLKTQGTILSCCLLLVACCSGCVRRSLTIRTDPPGALVYVNDELKGKSPVTYDFVWYGWHRVMVRKEGYERVEDRKQLRAPVYLWIPLDLAMELLPFPIRDTRTWEYKLSPAAAPAAPTPPPTFIPPTPTRPPTPVPPASKPVTEPTPAHTEPSDDAR